MQDTNTNITSNSSGEGLVNTNNTINTTIEKNDEVFITTINDNTNAIYNVGALLFGALVAICILKGLLKHV